MPCTFLGSITTDYSIFVVKGDLPDCEAEQLLQMFRVQQMYWPKLIGEKRVSTTKRTESRKQIWDES